MDTLSEADATKVNMIFHVMRGLYQHLFMSQFKSKESIAQAKRFWGKSMRVKTNEQIEKALLRMEQTHKKHPPTLPQFMDLFKVTREQALHNGSYDQSTYTSLPPKKNVLYKNGEITPAKMMADAITKEEETIEIKPLKIMNDLQYEAYLEKINEC